MRKKLMMVLFAIAMLMGMVGVAEARPDDAKKDKQSQTDEKGNACPDESKNPEGTPPPGCGQCPAGEEKSKGDCVPECDDGQTRDKRTGACELDCPDGQEDVDGECVAECEDGRTRDAASGACECGEGSEEFDGECVPICQEGETPEEDQCLPDCRDDQRRNTDTGECECAEGSEEFDGECVPICQQDETPEEDDCLPDCRDDQRRNTDTGECECAEDSEEFDGECVPVCTDNAPEGEEPGEVIEVPGQPLGYVCLILGPSDGAQVACPPGLVRANHLEVGPAFDGEVPRIAVGCATVLVQPLPPFPPEP